MFLKLFVSVNISVFPTDKRLTEKRKIFVDSVSEDTLNNLLDDVLNEKVLNQEESEKVKKGNVTTIAKARDLIDFVIPKGPIASQIFIGYICKRDSTLASKLGFSSGKIPQFCLRCVSICPCIFTLNICFLIHFPDNR